MATSALRLFLTRVLIRGSTGCSEYRRTVQLWKSALTTTNQLGRVKLLHDHIAPSAYSKWLDHRTATLYVGWVASPYVEIEEAPEGTPEKFRRTFIGGYDGSVSSIYELFRTMPDPEPYPVEELRMRYWQLQTRKERIEDALKDKVDPRTLKFADELYHLDLPAGPTWMVDKFYKRGCFEESTADHLELEEVLKKPDHERGKGTHWELPDTTPIPGWWGPDAPEVILARKKKNEKLKRMADKDPVDAEDAELGKARWSGRGRTNPVAKMKAKEKSDKKKARRAGDRERRNFEKSKAVAEVVEKVQQRLKELKDQGFPVIEKPAALAGAVGAMGPEKASQSQRPTRADNNSSRATNRQISEQQQQPRRPLPWQERDQGRGGNR